MKKILLYLLPFFFSFLLVGKTGETGGTIAPTQFNVGSFSFTRPAAWNWEVPTSAMRKAELTVPGKNGETVLVVFFHFGPGQGGSVQANIDRWAAQFSAIDGSSVKPITTTQKVKTTTVTFVSAHGTFASGMPGGPTQACSGYALRGAILESPQGDVYVKMTGPEKLVNQSAAIFDNMIATCCSF